MANTSELKALFKAFNSSGDGFVTKAQIEEAFKLVGAPASMGTIEANTLMTRDTTGNGKLSEEEFVVADYSLQTGRGPIGAGKLASIITSAKESKAKEEKVKAIKKEDLISTLAGPTLLVDAEGQTIETSKALENADFFAIYFSAHWCPPCRRFTPVLASSYKKINAAHPGKLVIAFSSADRSEGDFKSYFSTMGFNAIPFSDKERVGFEGLAAMRVGCNGIPKLAIWKKDGTLVSGDGVGLVMQHEDKTYQKLLSM